MVFYRRALLVAAIALVAAACQPGGNLDSVALTTGQPAPPAAQTVAVSPDDVVMASDAASGAELVATEPEPQHFIEFRARRGYTYGHSLVLFGRLDEEGDMAFVEVAGLTPGPEGDAGSFVAGHLVPVSAQTGFTAGDLDEDAVLARWRIMLSEDEYQEVAGFIRQLQERAPAWHATFYNCNAFVADIARHMGLRTPMTMMFPRQFVAALRMMNGGRHESAATAYAPPRPGVSASSSFAVQ